MTTLLTGFEPFHTHTENPSRLVARALAETDGISAHVLPVEYEAAGTAVLELMDRVRPRAVIMLGLAESAPRPRLERVALNIDDAEIPDNAGILRRGEPIKPNAPLALQTSLDLPALQSELAHRDFAVDISNHAGAYICNHIYFQALYRLTTAELATPCLFVHLPPNPADPKEAGAYLTHLRELTGALVEHLSDAHAL